MTALTLGALKLPHAGPYTVVQKIRSMGPGWQRDVQYISRQPKPWIHRLSYRREMLKNSAGADWVGLTLDNQNSVIYVAEWDGVYARAYDRFYSRVGAKAQMMMNLMDLPKTVQLFRDSIRTIASTARYLKRGDLRMVYRTLAVDPTSKQHVRLQKSVTASNRWLALQFGILPVVNDIYSCIDILQRDFPSDALSATYAKSLPWEVSNDSLTVEIEGFTRVSARILANIRISNPNVFLANQLGVLNPAGVAWDALPGSFILDWMLPVGKFCNSLSNDWGMELVEPTVSRLISGGCYGHHGDPFGTAEGYSLFRDTVSPNIPGLFDRAHLPKVSTWLLATEASLAIKSLANLFER